MCERCIHVYLCSLGFVAQILGITFIYVANMISYVFLSTLSGAAAHTAASYEIAMCSAPRCLENIILLTSDEYEAHCGRHFNV